VHLSFVVSVLPSLHSELSGSLPVQASAVSLQVSEQSASPSGPGHGLPEWMLHVPLLHVSVPLQYRPSLQAVPLALAGWVQVPPPHMSLVQASPSSVQARVLFTRWHAPLTHESVVQALLSLQSALVTHSGAVPAQTPAVHMSSVVSAFPSLQSEPLASARVQLFSASLHDSAQFASPSGPGHGLPEWTLHVPLLHVSDPLQYIPSLHAEPAALAGWVQAPALHTSFVQALPSSVQARVLFTRWHAPLTHESVVQALLSLQSALVTHSGAVPAQTPAVHMSLVVSAFPSLQSELSGSFMVQVPVASLHVSEQSASPSGPGQGLPACTQTPEALQVSAPLQ
jgi:hypothetical protein